MGYRNWILRLRVVCLQVHSKAFDILSGLAGTLKALFGPPLMSILGVALTGRLILKEKQLGGPSVPHEVEAIRDLVQPILDLSLLCADIGCRVLSAG